MKFLSTKVKPNDPKTYHYKPFNNTDFMNSINKVNKSQPFLCFIDNNTIHRYNRSTYAQQCSKFVFTKIVQIILSLHETPAHDRRATKRKSDIKRTLIAIDTSPFSKDSESLRLKSLLSSVPLLSVTFSFSLLTKFILYK